MKSILYIASNSASRKKILSDAQIPFQVIAQDADETQISLQQPLHEVGMQIAKLKMEHAQIPLGSQEGQICFVLTADTINRTPSGLSLCKPVDRADAIFMLHQARGGILTVTGFCVRKLVWHESAWQLVQEILDFDQAETIFNVPDDMIDFYLDAVSFLNVSGAISIEGVGELFLQSIHGNYGAVVGLPMFKVRQSLTQLGFYTKIR